MNAKIISLIVVVLLALIVVFQNTEVIKINLFFWYFEMSAIILVLFTLLIGAVGGFILGNMITSKEDN